MHFGKPEDWVFASERLKGKMPVAFDTILKKHIQPAAVAAEITKTVGRHTFRRSFASILAQSGEPVKVVQELMRHAKASTTQDLYQQADVASKRAAQSQLSGLFLIKKAS
jgi:site-specific recombinase XerD